MSHLLPLDSSIDYYGTAVDSWPYDYGAEGAQVFEDYVESPQRQAEAGPSGELSSPTDSITSYQYYRSGYTLSPGTAQHATDTHDTSNAARWQSGYVYGLERGPQDTREPRSPSTYVGPGAHLAEPQPQSRLFAVPQSAVPPSATSSYSTLRGAVGNEYGYGDRSGIEAGDMPHRHGVVPSMSVSAHAANQVGGPADPIARGYIAPWQTTSAANDECESSQGYSGVQYTHIPASQQLQLYGPPLATPRPPFSPNVELQSPVDGREERPIPAVASPIIPPPPPILSLVTPGLVPLPAPTGRSFSPEPVVKQENDEEIKQEYDEPMEIPDESNHAVDFAVVSAASQTRVDTSKLHASTSSTLQGALGPMQGTGGGHAVVAAGPYPTVPTSMQSQTPVPLEYNVKDGSPVQTSVATPTFGRGDAIGSRRGGRGIVKKPKKEQFLACFFCRGRKIACGPPSPDNPDRTCNQCARRHLICEYPLKSHRGQRRLTARDLHLAADGPRVRYVPRRASS